MIAELVTKDPQISFGAWIYLSRHAVPKFELRPARDHPMLGWGQVCRITDGVITAAWPDNTHRKAYFPVWMFATNNIMLFARIVVPYF